MINDLLSNDLSSKLFSESIGKTITGLSLSDDALHFVFTDGAMVKLFDCRQSCCEKRYMTTDDDLAYYVGSVLMDAEIANAPDEFGVHDVQFLKVKTSLGVFTMESHNEHNGYYGGFSITCVEDK